MSSRTVTVALAGPPLVNKYGSRNTWAVPMICRIRVISRTPRRCGIVTCQILRQSEAPSTSAASYSSAGGTVIIYLAAMTSVPAEVDGASLWRKIWHVTMPHLRGVLLITLILQIIGTAQVFLEPYLFTSGGPANATVTVLLLIYR